MRSVMKHQFSQVPTANIPRSAFNRSFGLKTTFNSGYLVPVFTDMAYPGDTFNVRMSSFCRLATPQVPVMDNLFIESFFFAVPLRLVWDNFQKFMGERRNPADSIDYLCPVVPAPASTGWTAQSLYDYFGIPINVTGFNVVNFMGRAYNLAWNEWFRDENLQDSITVDTDDGPDTPTDYVLRRRNKRFDYFTSGLPWPQKGPSVTLPLGTEAPITSKRWDGVTSNEIYVTDSVNGGRIYNDTAGTVSLIGIQLTGSAGSYKAQWQQQGLGTGNDNFGYNYADLSEATASTLNALRQAMQLQAFYERDARGGTRYTEIIQSHFNVISPDARLQRPEFLGGGSSRIHFTPIAQTSSSEEGSPQGNLAAMATTSFNGHGFIKSFTEHCVVFGVVSVRADLNYQQGLNKMWSIRTREEFYWPTFAQLGEQAVLNGEIYLQGTAADDDVFCYQERYAELRYKPSLITGQFRSTYSEPLDQWHFAPEFSSLPALNSTFIQENPPVERVLALQVEEDYPQFLSDFYFDFKAVRPMPMYGVPSSFGRF